MAAVPSTMTLNTEGLIKKWEELARIARSGTHAFLGPHGTTFNISTK